MEFNLTQSVVKEISFSFASADDVLECEVNVADNCKGWRQNRAHFIFYNQLVSLEFPDLP